MAPPGEGARLLPPRNEGRSAATEAAVAAPQFAASTGLTFRSDAVTSIPAAGSAAEPAGHPVSLPRAAEFGTELYASGDGDCAVC